MHPSWLENGTHAGVGELPPRKRAARELDEAISMLQNGEPVEVAELSAHYAYEALGKIIGEEVGEEILDTVFSKFCLGK